MAKAKTSAAKKSVKKGNNGLLAAEIGAGVLAAGAAAAGYYFYGTKDAKKHRNAAAKWAKGMKADVIKQAKKVEKLDKKVVASIVDQAQKTYQGVKNVDKAELMRAAMELKNNWQELQKELDAASKKTGKHVSSAVNHVKKAAAGKKAPAKKAAPKKTAKKAVKK
jgi:hypothetical protein